MLELLHRHAAEIWIAYHDGAPFIALHRQHGMIFARTDPEDLEAELNDLRPSIARKLTTTCAALFVDREGKA